MKSEWKEAALGEIVELVIDHRGKTPKKLGGDWSTSGYRALSAKNIKTGNIVQPETIRFLDEELYHKWMREEIQRGDILVTSEAPFGQIYYWDSDEKIVLSQRLFGLRIKKSFLARYIYYYMITHEFQKEMEGRATGTTVIGLRQPELLKCSIRYPDIQTQMKIAKILSLLDDKIALNQQINNKLEQQAQAIYIYLQKTANEKVSLSHFINIKHGYAFKGEYISSEDNGKVLVTPGNFKIGGGFKEERCKFFSGEIPEDYILKPGSLIVTMTDLSKQADTLGYGAFVPLYSDRIYLHNQRIGLITQTENTLPLEYIYWFLRSYEYHSFIVGSASGSTVKHTSPSRILEQAIPIPEKKKMEYLFPILKKINEQIDLNNYQNCKLKDIRDILLPRLMSGKIDISDIYI